MWRTIAIRLLFWDDTSLFFILATKLVGTEIKEGVDSGWGWCGRRGCTFGYEKEANNFYHYWVRDPDRLKGKTITEVKAKSFTCWL